MSPEQRQGFLEKAAQEHERRREQHASKKVKVPLAQARANRPAIDWKA